MTSRPLIFRRGGANDDATRSPFAAVKRIKLSKDSTDLVNREMQYDAAGNITKIVDGVNTETVDYTYDDLDRLLTASVPTGESFAYDTIGNMTSKAGAALDYGTTSPKHAVKSHGSTAYTYDANGSMTAKGTQTVKYDPEQRPIRIQDGTSVHRATTTATASAGSERTATEPSTTWAATSANWPPAPALPNPSPSTTAPPSGLSAGPWPSAGRHLALGWPDHLGGTIRVLDSKLRRTRWHGQQAPTARTATPAPA